MNKQFTTLDLIDMLNKSNFVAFNSTKRTPDCGVTLPNGEKRFVNRVKVGDKFIWQLGPTKIARV